MHTADGSPLHAVAMEDLLVLKLIADRRRDRIDLEGLAALPDLDWAYIERWCNAWGIADRLHALRRSGAS